MSQHSQIIKELGYKPPKSTFNVRSDGMPYSRKKAVTPEKLAQRQTSRNIEDIVMARELGISVQELREQ